MHNHPLPIWNHNSAYYPWIRKRAAGRNRILDVGCGDGTLALYLSQPRRSIVGIEPDAACFKKALCKADGSEVMFCNVDFESFSADQGSFDVVIFCASLHHMDALQAVEKAISLLHDRGLLLIVGLARPASAADWLIEALRVIPCRISSRLHRMQSPESLQIPTSNQTDSMDQIRALADTALPGVKLRQGLYYRYLLYWEKPAAY